MTESQYPGSNRIIFVSQLYDPEPTVKGARFVEALQQFGYEVEALTGFPNYPGGVVYPGYHIRPIVRETIKGTRVTRVFIYPSHDRNAIKRLICYFSFFLSSFLYLTFRAKKAKLIYVSYPSLTTGLAAVGAKFFRRTPVVLDIQDMWPDSLAATGMVTNDHFIRLVGWLCLFLYRRVDHIIVQSEGFRKLLIGRGVPEQKISVILNWADESQVKPSPEMARGYDLDDNFKVLFAGNLGTAQGLETVVDAAGLLAKSQQKITIYFLGSGVALESLKAKAEGLKLKNIRFLPRVGLDEVQNYLAGADCLLVHLNSSPLFKITIPSKTQAYLHAGKPIVMAMEGDAAELVLKAGAGFSCSPGNPEELSETITKVFNLSPQQRLEMGKAGRRFYNRELTLKNYMHVLVRIIDQIIGASPPAR